MSCVGATLQLSASTAAGATYSWTGPNGFSSILQNPNIPNATTAASGTYSVTVTVNGCTSAAGQTTASVNSVLAITQQPQNVVACNGGTATFTASASGTAPVTVRWQADTGNGFADISGATSTTVTVAANPSTVG